MNMKRLCVLILFLPVLLFACLFGTGHLAPTFLSANAEEEIRVRFYHAETLLSEALQPVGQAIDKPSDDLFPHGEDETLLWRLASGEFVTFPFVPAADVDLFCEVSAREDVATYSFRFDCLNDSRYRETTVTFRKGEATGDLLALPSLTAKGEIIGFYSSPTFSESVVPPGTANEDVILYPRYRINVRIRFNGEIVSCPYGANLSDVLGSETHAIGVLYLDQERTIPYPYNTAFDGLYVYGDLSRTHYNVRFVSEETEEVLLVPIGSAVAEDRLPDAFLDLDLFVGDETIDLPFTPTDDVTIVGKRREPKRYDAVVWSVLAVIVFLAGALGVFFGKFYPKVKEKRAKKSEPDENRYR